MSCREARWEAAEGGNARQGKARQGAGATINNHSTVFNSESDGLALYSFRVSCLMSHVSWVQVEDEAAVQLARSDRERTLHHLFTAFVAHGGRAMCRQMGLGTLVVSTAVGMLYHTRRER